MTRKIDILVEGCDSCPLCVFDGYYDMTQDSGWDCVHPEGNFRIADEGKPSADGVEARIGKPFPDNCPLAEVTHEA